VATLSRFLHSATLQSALLGRIPNVFNELGAYMTTRPGAGSAPHSLITTATTPVVVTRRAGLCALATTEWQLAATA
jgi:hypothetical protein